MIKYMETVAKVSFSPLMLVKAGQELTSDERNLLSLAYKNAVSKRRAAWRTIVAIQNKEELKVSQHVHLTAFQGNKYLPTISDYKLKIEEELSKYCNDVLNLIDKHLVTGTDNPEHIVFYYKMKGDYYRYLSEY